jgi:hypothetical protein
MQSPLIVLMPHVSMASTGQNGLHCPHPTHLAVIFNVAHLIVFLLKALLI